MVYCILPSYVLGLCQKQRVTWGICQETSNITINRTETDPNIGGEASHFFAGYFEHTQKLGERAPIWGRYFSGGTTWNHVFSNWSGLDRHEQDV